MRQLIMALLVAATTAVAGCGGSGSDGCSAICQWMDECYSFSVPVSDCTRACRDWMSSESSACRSAYDDFGACVDASGSCTPTECEAEAEAVSQHCEGDF